MLIPSEIVYLIYWEMFRKPLPKEMQKLPFVQSIRHALYRGVRRGKLLTASPLLRRKESVKAFLSPTAASGGPWLQRFWFRNASLAPFTLCCCWALWMEKPSAPVTLLEFSSSCSDKLPPQLLYQTPKSICLTEEVTTFWVSAESV